MAIAPNDMDAIFAELARRFPQRLQDQQAPQGTGSPAPTQLVALLVAQLPNGQNHSDTSLGHCH